MTRPPLSADDAAFVDEMAKLDDETFTRWRPEQTVEGVILTIAERDRLVALARVGLQWRCFHCDEVFTTHGAARDHFGATPGAQAGCVIDRVAPEEGGKPERGRGLLMALRKQEAENERLTQQLVTAHETVKAQAIAAVRELDADVPRSEEWTLAIEAAVRALTALRPTSNSSIKE